MIDLRIFYDKGILILLVVLGNNLYLEVTPLCTLTMIHLLPSSANLGGFFAARCDGFFGTSGFLPAGAEDGEDGAGTLTRSDGFLWVISLFSTLRRPLVTPSPLLSSANTAAGFGGAEVVAAGAVVAGGGGGGGGGEGVPPVELAFAPAMRSLTLPP